MRIIKLGESVWLPLLQGYVTSREVLIKHTGLITQLKKGGGGSTSTNTIQNADPWVGQQPYIKDVLAEAQKQYQGAGPVPYSGDMVANQTADTIAGQNALRTAANGSISGIASQGQQAAGFGLADVLNPQTNQYLQDSVNQSIQPIIQNFQESVLPSLRSGAGNAGQYGGTRQGIAEGLATDRLGQTISNMVSNRYSDAYDRGLQTFEKTLALLPQTAQLQTLQGTTLDAIGQQNQQQAQNELSAQIGQYNDLQNLDANKLAAYQQLIQGNYGGQSSSTATGPGAPQTSWMANALGGAATGASLATSLGMSGPWGAGIGAVLSLF